MAKMKMGVIMGNRNFFADELCLKARKKLLPQLEKLGIEPVILAEEEGVYGSVENWQDAKKCARLFRQNKDEIKGIIVTLPNFSSEKSIAETLRMSELEVPVLIHAFPDDKEKLDYSNRRDSFCGKISVCNNLKQYGINFTLTELHNEAVDSENFKKDIEKFKGICRVVDSLKNLRVGVVGPRPADFNTVRYSEKILENNNISVEPIGVINLINKIKEIDKKKVENRVDEIKKYINTEEVPESALEKMGGFYEVFANWIEENDLDTVALQCWDSLQQYLGINPCTVMSILSNKGVPASCEVDVMGSVSMLALQAAAEKPAGLADWNNNYGKEKDRCILFHCGNFARDLYSNCKVNFAEILGSTLGKEKTYGAVYGNIKPGNLSFARVSTNDINGKIKAYVAEGKVIDEELAVNGSRGVVEVPELQELLQYICRQGFEHHVAISLAPVGDILEEAFSNYLGWEVYNHL